MFFSGDTGLTTEYAAIRERFGRFDLVMLEVGAFHPTWGDIHLGPANALKALDLAGRRCLSAGALNVQPRGARSLDEPAETLLQLAPGHGAQLLMPRLGEPVEPSHGARAQPWWRGIGQGAPAPAPAGPVPDATLPGPPD